MWTWGSVALAADVLFVGNSYTEIRDLDGATRVALDAMGDAGIAVRLAEGGFRWVDHVDRAQTPGTPWEQALVLADPTFQWGVLQEQSQILGLDAASGDRVTSLEAARTLDGWLAAQGADTLLLLTWGRRDGDPDFPDRYPDYLTMQALLLEGTVATRDALTTPARPVWIAPAGLAWQAVYEDDPDPAAPGSTFAALYQPDGSHPSVAGNWLNALVIATTLTGGDPEGVDPPAGLDPALAGVLAEAAADVVLGGRDGGLGLTYPWTPSTPPATTSTPTTETTVGTEPDAAGPGEVVAEGGCGCDPAGPVPASAGLLAALAAALGRRSRRGSW